jgi:hypothetical protein
MYGGGPWLNLLRGAVVSLAVAAGIALAGVEPATAVVPPKRCGKLEVQGKTYKVSTHRRKCDFARKWSKRYLKNGQYPAGWTCASYPPEETRIVFSCRKRQASYYAVRK